MRVSAVALRAAEQESGIARRVRQPGWSRRDSQHLHSDVVISFVCIILFGTYFGTYHSASAASGSCQLAITEIIYTGKFKWLSSSI